MYIEKKKTKKGIKYYLAHSFREGNKIHKIRKLLGTDLNKGVLEERIKKAEQLIKEETERYQIIQDPLEKELTKEEIAFVERLQKENNFKIYHLSEKQWELFSKIFTYNTNAIEGSELTNTEVNQIIEKDKWPKEKSKEDIAETYGVDEAIKLIRETKEHLSLDLLKEIHKIVFKNSKSFAGEFRQKGQEVVVMSSSGKIVHEGAPQSRVIGLLDNLVKWYEEHKSKYPPLVLAAVVHNQFENIHPFADGNGRIGRIILNNILIKHNLPPINIELRNRLEYYNTLQEYEKSKNIRPTIEFLLKEYRATKKELNKNKA
ncbi:MAG: Fic family protein [Nanoarchaeota archaeon]|nr:Fic family protein [Nanoarchaeota archaeon]